jgi:superoxide dismutase
MIFAEMQYKEDYSVIHAELVNLIQSNFSNVQSGLQGDSWIWVSEDNDRVAIDTFSSMKHQVKCEKHDCALINKVINILLKQYRLQIYKEPELEPHEDY